MTALNTFADRCWADHADDPHGVADRLKQGIPLVDNSDGLARLAMLVHHVYGEHLGRWDPGLHLLDRLAELDVPGEAGQRAVARCRTSLNLCADGQDERPKLPRSDACRATAMAACSLARHDSVRASALLEEAAADTQGLANDDPAVRALASFGNNTAVALQEKGDLIEGERNLMLRAAELARAHWERAGGWREVARAEYRLALCWWHAGSGAHALQHAQRCHAIVLDNGSEPLEAFFAAEAMALAAELAGRRDLFSDALRTAESSFKALPAADQGGCQATLDKLQARHVHVRSAVF